MLLEFRGKDQLTAYLWNLNLSHELASHILKHNSIRGSKEGQHMADEMPFIRFQGIPVFLILKQIYLLSCDADISHKLVSRRPSLWSRINASVTAFESFASIVKHCIKQITPTMPISPWHKCWERFMPESTVDPLKRSGDAEWPFCKWIYLSRPV